MLPDELAEILLSALRYGEACYDYGLANPLNQEQCVRLSAAKQKAWDVIVEKLKNLKLEN